VPDDRYTADDLAWLAAANRAEEVERPIVARVLVPGPRGPRVKHLRANANELIARRLNRFKGMGCHAGVEMLSIGLDGRIDPAVCFRRMKRARPNIYRDPEIPVELRRGVVCPFEACGCPEDIAITKVALDGGGLRHRSGGDRVRPRQRVSPFGQGGLGHRARRRGQTA
jgi:hypothetical protein